MSHLTRGSNLWLGSGSKAIADGHQHENGDSARGVKEVSL